jgi:glycosyltransferase involved in cell wall biosynthesis
MSSRVDVLMATYNGRSFVREQIDSILNQTHLNIRLLVCDDCSTDGTHEYVSRLLSSLPNAVVYRNPTNLGTVKTFEALLQRVASPYFAFADQDDVWLTDKIERSLSLMIEKDLQLVYSDLEVVDATLRQIAPSMWKYSGVKPLDASSPIPYLLRNPVSGCTMLVDSRLLAHCLPMPDETPMHDWWIVLRATQVGKVGFLNAPTVKYRQHGSNALGANKSALAAFWSRLASRGLTTRRYAVYRAKRRIALAESLLERSVDPEIQRFLRYVQMPLLWRILWMPGYFMWLMRAAPQLGARGILIESGMNALPRSPYHE